MEAGMSLSGLKKLKSL